MKQNHPKQYLVLTYYAPVEDILLVVVREAFSQKDAIGQARAYYARHKYHSLPPDVPMRALRIPLDTKVGEIGLAHVDKLPVIPTESQYTPEIVYV